MIKLFLGIIAIVEVSRVIIDIISMIGNNNVMKRTLEEQKKVVEINGENLERTKSYSKQVDLFNDMVSQLSKNQKVLNENYDFLKKKIEGQKND